MPATSKAQRRAMAVAEHSPEKLKGKNKGLAKMSKEKLHEFASTKEKGLPQHAKSKSPKKNDKYVKSKPKRLPRGLHDRMD